jgi:hypothetical protein
MEVMVKMHIGNNGFFSFFPWQNKFKMAKNKRFFLGFSSCQISKFL